MNQRERTYAVRRINEIAAEKIRNADQPTGFTPQERKQWLKENKVVWPTTAEIKEKIKREMDRFINNSSSTLWNFDIRLDATVNGKSYKGYSTKVGKPNSTFNSVVSKIKDRATAICDETMLGDSEEAIKMIEAFKKESF